MVITKYPVHPAAMLFPNQTKEEYADLVADMRVNGQRVACVLWHEQLLDGRHRVSACEEIGIEPIYEDRSDIADPLSFVVSLNYVHRSLTDSQKDAIAAELANWDSDIPLAKVLQSQRAKERQEEVRRMSQEGMMGKEIAEVLGVSTSTISGDLRAPEKPAPPVIGKTIEQAADLMGRGRTTVKKALSVQREAPDLLEGMKDGIIATGDAYKNKNIPENIRREALETVTNSRKVRSLSDAIRDIQRQRSQEQSLIAAGSSPQFKRVQLYTASAKDAMDIVPANSIDVVVTDPPYPRAYLSAWKELAEFSAHVLKDGGAIIAMSGQAFLPEVFELMKHPEIFYRWTACYYYNNPRNTGANVRYRQFHNFWKPVLIYHKNVEQKEMDKSPVFVDYFYEDRQGTLTSVDDKMSTHHGWGQSVHIFKEMLRRYTSPGDMICDPFLGSGTTALAMLEIGEGRRFVGGDIDGRNVEITRGRVAEWIKSGFE